MIFDHLYFCSRCSYDILVISSFLSLYSMRHFSHCIARCSIFPLYFFTYIWMPYLFHSGCFSIVNTDLIFFSVLEYLKFYKFQRVSFSCLLFIQVFKVFSLYTFVCFFSLIIFRIMNSLYSLTGLRLYCYGFMFIFPS